MEQLVEALQFKWEGAMLTVGLIAILFVSDQLARDKKTVVVRKKD